MALQTRKERIDIVSERRQQIALRGKQLRARQRVVRIRIAYRNGSRSPAYHVTKAALNAMTRTLAGELRQTHILVNAVCPGWVATDMGGAGALRSVSEGAADIVWAATSPDDGLTGGFFRDGKPLPW